MAKPLTDAINALTTYANTVTGASDTTLSEAVATLANGYGGGGFSADDIATGNIQGAINIAANTIRDYAFYKCTGLTSVESTTLTSLPAHCFSDCSYITSANFPNVTSLAANVFYQCTRLATIALKNVTTITGGSIFQRCSALQYIVLPKANQITSDFIYGSGVKALDLGSVTSFANYSMRSTGSFGTLIIRNSSVPSLGNLNAINGTPFASNGAGGTLYVPSALISSYQSANNWSTILGYANNQILPIEGSIYETQYADGTPIE